jgi:protein gp37
MQHAWARELRAKARAAGTAFFFKQSAAPRTEMGIELDGRIVREFPAVTM